MSWDEFEVRSRQELTKRLDVALCGMGLAPGRNGLLQGFNPPGEFFFSQAVLSRRVSLLQEHLPRRTDEIVAEADQICRHRFQLLGYSDLDYGAEIDWHLDAVHNRRAPLIPWFKIDFLRFDEIGDHKVTWELSRHQHLVTLAKAWLLTGEETYAREILAQWYSWRRANPYPLGANWASSLEVAFRSISWLWLLHLLAECPAVNADFRNDVLRALAVNGRHIEKYLSTYFSPNTHLIGEAVALFFIGVLCPQISSAGKWRKLSWQIIQQEAERQVRHDGVYFEQSLYYHVYALDFFLHARLLASKNGVQIPNEFDLALKRMLDVVAALAQTAPPDGFGDDDGGRVFDPRRNRAEHMTDPLAVGCVLFQQGPPPAGAGLTEEAIWLFGEEAIHWITRTSKLRVSPESHAFLEGGLYVVAAGSNSFSEQMVIDAGPQGTGHSGHGHADALSIKLAVGDRNWLVDAGTFCYIGQGNERETFRGTRAHNTLAVDGLDQAEPHGPFAWSSIPDIQPELWIAGTRFSLFAGSHSGYERLPEPVRHRRFVFHRKGQFWLIRDVADGQGSHLLETSWHFAPDLEVSKLANGFVAAPASDQSTRAEASHQLIVVPVADSPWRSEIVSEYVSPAYGAKLSAPVVRCSARINLPAEHAMLLIPAVGGTEEACTFVRLDQHAETGAPKAVYRYTHGSVTHTMIFREAQPATWSHARWASDARFLYFCVKDRRVEQMVVCDASFVRLAEKSLVSHGTTLQWLEWNRQDPQPLASSDAEAFGSFFGSVLDSELAL